MRIHIFFMYDSHIFAHIFYSFQHITHIVHLKKLFTKGDKQHWTSIRPRQFFIVFTRKYVKFNFV